MRHALTDNFKVFLDPKQHPGAKLTSASSFASLFAFPFLSFFTCFFWGGIGFRVLLD